MVETPFDLENITGFQQVHTILMAMYIAFIKVKSAAFLLRYLGLQVQM